MLSATFMLFPPPHVYQRVKFRVWMTRGRKEFPVYGSFRMGDSPSVPWHFDRLNKHINETKFHIPDGKAYLRNLCCIRGQGLHFWNHKVCCSCSCPTRVYVVISVNFRGEEWKTCLCYSFLHICFWLEFLYMWDLILTHSDLLGFHLLQINTVIPDLPGQLNSWSNLLLCIPIVINNTTLSDHIIVL